MAMKYIAPIEIDDDHQIIALNFTGGIKAWKTDRNQWSFGPIIYEGRPAIIGTLTHDLLKSATKQMELTPIIFENRMSINGLKSTIWKSVYTVKKGNNLTATDIWHTISRNITSARVSEFQKSNPSATEERVLEERSRYTPEERYSDYISDSLRSMDICMSEICNYYHEQLTFYLQKSRFSGEQSSSVADLPFIAFVHSFFLHFGAARDYLGALIAHRCGLPERVDDMARLTKELRWQRLPDEPMLRYLIDIGYLSPKENSTKSRQSGWLEQVSNVRNELVHKRPFGSHAEEKLGKILLAGGIDGHYRYFKPISLRGKLTVDALDYISDVYHKTMHLFGEMALQSGKEAKVPTLTDEDILDIKIHTGITPDG